MHKITKKIGEAINEYAYFNKFSIQTFSVEFSTKLPNAKTMFCGPHTRNLTFYVLSRNVSSFWQIKATHFCTHIFLYFPSTSSSSKIKPKILLTIIIILIT